MNNRANAGVIKSWACILSLTFLLPAGAVRVSEAMLHAGASGAASVRALIYDSAPVAEEIVAACPELRAEDSG